MLVIYYDPNKNPPLRDGEIVEKAFDYFNNGCMGSDHIIAHTSNIKLIDCIRGLLNEALKNKLEPKFEIRFGTHNESYAIEFDKDMRTRDKNLYEAEDDILRIWEKLLL